MFVNEVWPGKGVWVVWSVFCCEECCLLWVSRRAGVAAVTDAGLPVFTESRYIQPTHTGPDTSA